MTQNLNQMRDVRDIGRKPEHVRMAASAEDMADIQQRLNLLGLSAFEAELTVQEIAGAIRIVGHVTADVVQPSVVSLEPVPDHIDDHFVLELVSEDEAARRDEDESYADPDAPEYDALTSDSIDLGDIAVQTLAMALDPYPRRSDENLSDSATHGVEIDGGPLAPESPFAALKDMAPKQ